MSVETAIILRAVNKASAVIGEVQGELNALNNQGMGSLTSNLAGVGKMLSGVIVAGAGAALVAVGAFVGSGIKGATDLQAQMSGVAAVLGLTAEEAQPLKDLVQGLAIDPKLKVNATEAAAAIEMLARNGLGMQEIMTGAAHGTVLLANATGADFSVAANIATDVMAQFGIEAEDFGSAVDGITSVVNNSKFGINDYALAISQGGGVAATAGVSFEDFNTTIAAISPLFGSGSDAGTSFKTMLTSMANPSNSARKAIAGLGLDFFDASGNMKDMATIGAELNQALYGTSTVMVEVGGRTAEQADELARLQKKYDSTTLSIADYEAGISGAGLTEAARAKKLQDLRLQQQAIESSMGPLLSITGEMTTATKTLTEEERTKALATIFGSDAMRAAAGLAESGAVLYTDMAVAAEQLGVSQDDLAWAVEGGITQYEALMVQMGQTSALDAAGTRVDNLAGDMDIFSGVVEALKLKVGDALLPALRKLYQMGTNLLTVYGEPIAAAFGDVIGAIGPFFDRISEGESPLNSLLIATSNLGTKWGFNVKEIKGFNDKIKLFYDNIGTAIEKVKEFIEPIAEFIKKYVGMKDVLIAAGIAIAAFVIPALASLIVFLAPIIATVLAVIAAVALFRLAWENNFLGIQQIVQGFADFFGQMWEGIKQLFSGDTAGALESFGEAFEGLKETVVLAFTNIYTAVSEWAASVDWGAIGQAIIDALFVAWEFISEKAAAAFSYVYTAISEWVAGIDWAAVGMSIVDLMVAGFSVLTERIIPWYWSFYEATLAWIAGIDWAAVWNTITTFLSGIFANIATDAITGLTTMFENMTAWVNEQDWEAIGYTLTTMFITGVKKIWDETSTFLSEFWTNMQSFFNDTDWGELSETVVTKIAVGLAKLWTTAKIKFDTMYSSIEAWFAEKDWSALATDLIDGLVLGITNGIMSVVNAATNLASGVSQAISDAWNSNSPSKWAIDKAMTIGQGIVIGLDNSQASSEMAGADLGQAVTGGVNAGLAAGVQDNRQTVYNQTWNVNTNSLDSGRESMAARAFNGGI